MPPDGLFKLIEYQLKSANNQQSVPLYCNPRLTYTDYGGKIEVVVGYKPIINSMKNDRIKAPENVFVIIPFPTSVLTQDLATNKGKFHNAVYS